MPYKKVKNKLKSVLKKNINQEAKSKRPILPSKDLKLMAKISLERYQDLGINVKECIDKIK